MQGDLFGRLLPWLGGLLVLALAGAGLMVFTRRMAVGKQAPGAREGFELDDLRSLMERGEITPEEYDRARRRMVDRARQSRTQAAKTASGTQPKPRA
jgi:hypothetical protein